MKEDPKVSKPRPAVSVGRIQAGNDAIVAEKIERLTINHRGEDESRSGPRGLSFLMAGDYSSAASNLKKALNRDPEDTFLNVALGIALSGGTNLRHLDYRVANEIHRHFSIGFRKISSRSVSALALAALKIDYFRKNSVRDEPPTFQEIHAATSRAKLETEEENILSMFRMNAKTRARLGL